jgi:hypothetical protein
MNPVLRFFHNLGARLGIARDLVGFFGTARSVDDAWWWSS